MLRGSLFGTCLLTEAGSFMHKTLVRLLRHELNSLPAAVQWSKLAELTHQALDLVLLQQKYLDTQRRLESSLWEQNNKIHKDMRELARALKYYLEKDPPADVTKQRLEELIDKAMKDKEISYGIKEES
jgi:hypothetical protein